MLPRLVCALALSRLDSNAFRRPCRTPSDNTGAIAASLARRRPTCPPELTPARPRDARTSGTAVHWLPVPRAGLSLSCVYWFTRYSLAVFMIPQRSVNLILLLTYPEDPQSGQQAAVTALCHVYKSSPGTELYLFLIHLTYS